MVEIQQILDPDCLAETPLAEPCGQLGLKCFGGFNVLYYPAVLDIQ